MVKQEAAKAGVDNVGGDRRIQRRDAVTAPANDAGYYLIGDLARDFGVTLRALRFYEDKGLLQPGRRGAVRLYDAKDRERLAIILKGKQLGFTLGEISGMIDRNDGNFDASAEGLTLRLSVDQISDQIRHLEAQKRDIESAITELEQSRAEVCGLGAGKQHGVGACS